jgi:hypothetical protein
VNFWSVIERVSCFFTHVQKTRKKKPNVYCEKPRGELSNQSFFSSSSICKTPIHQTCRKKKEVGYIRDIIITLIRCNNKSRGQKIWGGKPESHIWMEDIW